ncbi:urease accessory protein UreD [Corynebacterium halotolerans]|uniref:Urease accessory protein UreD n=1 Tax=Corynebacterium halotolerans YIM 70093 = DSM 44683 TaxID=1121362 RepID=M1P8G1_9CORY|nr:urease accessory protein UreD [Corynebacterium halotolerans]AGF72951.1 urease accessory protein UreD [Corynebacterium halotolerans YIM 70093 = DSM 44683]
MTTATVEPAGELRLMVDHRDGVSRARRQFHRGALRILRPHYLDGSGQVTYTLINPGGAYFSGDRYLIDIEISPESSLLLTTQSATKVYRAPKGPATQDMRVVVGAGATFEYLPDQLIVYRDGSYRQRTVIEAHPSATVVLAEVITPGWSPEGANFTFDELRMRTELRLLDESTGSSRIHAVDQLRIIPDSVISGVGFMEGHSHTGQLILMDPRIDDSVISVLSELVDASDTYSGITCAGLPRSDGDAPRCVFIRSLAETTGSITALHHDVVTLLRRVTGGRAAVNLRKH